MPDAKIMDNLRNLLREIEPGAKKTAQVQDPGGYGTTSTHPTTKLDDNTSDPTTGAMSSENDKHLRDMLPTGAIIGDAPSNGAAQSSLTMAPASLPGDAPAIERNFTTNDKDPGTSSPVKFSIGEKYGSYDNKPFSELYKTAGLQANEILAAITVQADSTKTASAPAPAKAGFDLAKAAASLAPAAPKQEQTKVASVSDQLRPIIQDALIAGALTAQFYREKVGSVKRAEGGPPMDPMAGGAPPMDPMAGGAPPMDPMAGGAPPMDPAAGGAPPDAGAGMDPDQLVEQVLQSLFEMGITPDDLMQKLQSMGGAEGGGAAPPPAAGGDTPPEPPVTPGEGKETPAEETAEKEAAVKRNLDNAIKIASSAVALRNKKYREGTLQYGPPKTAQEQQIRSEVRDFVKEVFSR